MDSAKLLDNAKKELGLRNDSDLARKLNMDRGNICSIRAGRLKVGATFLCKLSEATGLNIKQIKELA